MDAKLLLLKKYVLLKSSITALTPSDCKKLSLLISKAVNKNISETTIKRLYGFAEVKHSFSKYTITALCEYLGKESWEQFCTDVEDKSENIHLSKWDELAYKAKTISNLTVKTIKNKSSIPFQFTVNREFAERDFNYFYNRDYTYCSFISQPGFGKSIMLAHLVEKFFLEQNAIYKDDMLWFINPNMLPGLEYVDFNLEVWFDEQMNNTPQKKFINYFKENYKELRGKVVIIFDGFDEIAIKKDQLIKLINSVADFVFSNANNNWMKVVLSMRTVTWFRFYEKIRHSAYIKSKWFAGNYVANEDYSNIPPLTDKEIERVVRNFSGEKAVEINPQIKAQLKFPFYIHIYYQLLQEGTDLKHFTDLTFYELVSNFVHYKINLSPHYTEKVLLLKKFIQLTSKIQKGNLVYKESFLNDIILFKDAYDELIFDGILIEEKQFGEVMPIEVVRFQQTHVFEYFLFIEIVEKQNRIIDSEYLNKINTEYENSSLRLKLLQWTVRYVIINGNAEALKDIIRLNLAVDEKKYLLFFIAEMLESKSDRKHTSFYRIKNDEQVYDLFLTELLNLDFTDLYYKNTLKCLKNTVVPGPHKLIYTSLLAYIAFFELDMAQLQIELEELKELKEFDKQFAFSQIDAIQLIYSKLVDNVSSDEVAHLSLNKFIKGYLFLTEEEKQDMALKDIISYISICIVSILYGKVEDLFETISTIHKKHPDIFIKRDGLSLYMLIVAAFVNLKLAPSSVKRMLKHITLVKNSLGDSFHSFFYVMLCLVMTIYNKLIGNNEQSIIYIEEGLAICELKKIHSFEAIFLIIAINIYNNIGDIDKEEQVAYRLHCLLEEKNVAKNSLVGFFKQLKTQNNYSV